MIGIIGAMDIEIAKIAEAMSGSEELTHFSIPFLWGKIGEQQVVLAKCGIGKVNAAVCAAAMFTEFGADIIINTGVAGGLSPDLRQLDLVVSSAFVQHDYDLSPIGMQKGFIPEINSVTIESDRELSEKALSLAGDRAFSGIIATGDSFIASSEASARIRNEFGAAACDMEGGAIAQVCRLAGIRHLAVRCISDNADGSAGMSYDKFSAVAAEKCSKLVLDLMEVI